MPNLRGVRALFRVLGATFSKAWEKEQVFAGSGTKHVFVFVFFFFFFFFSGRIQLLVYGGLCAIKPSCVKEAILGRLVWRGTFGEEHYHKPERTNVFGLDPQKKSFRS